MELVGTIAQWIATIVVASALAYNMRQNGRNRDAKDIQLKSELKSELNNVKNKLDDPENGLGAIKKSLDDWKIYCARTSSTLTQKIKSLEEKEK